MKKPPSYKRIEMPIQDKEKIQVGLLLDSCSILAWEYLMLEKITECKVANIQLIVKNNCTLPDNNISTNSPKYYLYNLFTNFDKKYFNTQPDALEPKDATDLLAGVPELKITPDQNPGNFYIEKEDLKKIREFNIDVFIQLGFKDLRGEILSLPKFGVWSHFHGDPARYKGRPTGFWEVFEQFPVTGSTLQVLTDDTNEPLEIYKSFSCTDSFSVVRNNNFIYWKSSSFVTRKLEDCYKSGESFLKKEDHPEKSALSSRPIYKTPTNGKAALLLLRHIKKYLPVKLSSKTKFEQWQLRFSIDNEISKSFSQFKPMIPPKDRFWADPFIIFKDGVHYIFLEELEFKDDKGYLSVITMDKNGNYSTPKKILERPYHLSYPFTFEWRNELYMIPETAANRSIEIYKCTDFPHKWELHKTIFEKIDAVDTTLFFHNETWWMFTNIRETQEAYTYDDELYLFYSDNPLSDNWNPHPLNPIISDVSKARPAGRIYEHKGEIFRPSQNCGGRYGRGLNINKILKLSTTEYEEVQVETYEPDWDKDLLGTHHLSHENGLTLIDVCASRSNFF
jgi:hypothetical protein